MENPFSHYPASDSLREKRLIYQYHGEPQPEQSSPEQAPQRPSEKPREELNNNKNAAEKAAEEQQEASASLAGLGETVNTVDAVGAAAGESVSEGAEIPQTHAERLSAAIGNAYEKFSAAQGKLDAAHEKGDKKEEVKARWEVMAAVGEMLAVFIEFLKRVFNGTLMENANEKPEDKSAKSAGDTLDTSPAASAETPQDQVQNELQQRGPQSPQELSANLGQVQENAEQSVEKNRDSIKNIDKRVDELQSERTEASKQLEGAKNRVIDLKQEGASQADIESANATIKRLEGQLKLVEQEIADQMAIRGRLEAENKRLEAKAGAAREMKENLDPVLTQFNKMIKMLKEAMGAQGVSMRIEHFAPIIVVSSPNAQIKQIIGARTNKEGRAELGAEDARRLQEAAENKEPLAEEPEGAPKPPTETVEGKEQRAKDAKAIETSLKGIFSRNIDKKDKAFLSNAIRVEEAEEGKYQVVVDKSILSGHANKSKVHELVDSPALFRNVDRQTNTVRTTPMTVEELSDFYSKINQELLT